MFHNGEVLTVAYGNSEFTSTCNQFLVSNQSFIVVSEERTAAKYRNAVRLFLASAFERPKGFVARMKLVAKLALAGMRVAPLLAICNAAILKNWDVTVLDDGNQIAGFAPAGKSKVPGSN